MVSDRFLFKLLFNRVWLSASCFRAFYLVHCFSASGCLRLCLQPHIGVSLECSMPRHEADTPWARPFAALPGLNWENQLRWNKTEVSHVENWCTKMFSELRMMLKSEALYIYLLHRLGSWHKGGWLEACGWTTQRSVCGSAFGFLCSEALVYVTTHYSCISLFVLLNCLKFKISFSCFRCLCSLFPQT